MELISREAFREAVLARDKGKCVVCHEPAVEAHHLYERKLWPDGGYYVEQAVALCADHHIEADATNLSPTLLARLASIDPPVVPPGLDQDTRYDKWGNLVVVSGDGWEERTAGPQWSTELGDMLCERCRIILIVNLPDGTVTVI